MAILNFNANNVAPQTAFEPLPAGWYSVAITASEAKPTKDGTGSYLQLELTIIDGALRGRKVFDRLNLWNKNTTAVEIAGRQLSAICHATSKLEVNDSTDLHNIPIEAKVALKAASAGYEASNDVKGYRALVNSVGSPAPIAPAIPTAPVAPTAPIAPVAPAPAPVQAPVMAAPIAPPAAIPTQPAPVAPVAPAPSPLAANTAPSSFPWAAPTN